MMQKLIPESNSDGIDYSDISTKLEGYSGSDIKLVCKEAAMKPLRRLMHEIEGTATDDDYNWTPPD